MTIPYESVLDEEERSLESAFFRVLPVDQDTYVAALLLIDGSGEPLEFTYNRASVRRRLLWRDEDLQLALTRELLTSLLETCPRERVSIDPGRLFGEHEIFGLFGLTSPQRKSRTVSEKLAK